MDSYGCGLAYYLTKSNSNEQLRAHYQKVRIAQKLIGAVDAAFFRLLALQYASSSAERHYALRAQVAERLGALLQERYADIQRYHQARKNAVKARRLCRKIANEMERERNLLASAMAISPDSCVDGGFIVVGELLPPAYRACIAELELLAIQNRPEGFEAGLNHLNSVNDVRRTMVKYCPRVTGFWRYTRDKDRYLWNKDWNDVGVLIYFDFVEWLSNIFENEAASSTSAKTHREIGAIALGITSQVRLSALRYFDSLDEFDAVEKDLAGSERVLSVAEKRSSADDLDRIALTEATANVLQDKLERLRALGEVNATLAELNSQTGTNYQEGVPQNCKTN